MPSSGPKPTDLTKKKSPAKKPEEKAQPEVVNGDAAAPVENGHNGHHVDGDEAEPAVIEA
jgi:hypothetical protein